MHIWGLVVHTTCLLCQIDDETQNIFYLNCEYSKSIWKVILLKNKSLMRLSGQWLIGPVIPALAESTSLSMALLQSMACGAKG